MPRRPPTDVMETTVAIYQPTADLALSSSIMALNFAFEERARELVISATNGLGYTNAEIIAMTKLEQLKLINGMDLAAIYMRHAVIRQIREGSLFSMHPENFNSDKAMAQAAGISGSEFDNIIDLVEVIFPYVTETLGRTVADVWAEVGKSNMREMVPTLKMLITGEESQSDGVQRRVNEILDNLAASAAVNGETIDAEALRAQAVQAVIEDGARLTNRQLRRQLRPDRTEPVNASVIVSGGRRIVIMDTDADQWTMVQRVMGSHLDPVVVELPADPRQRQIEATRLPELRALIDLVSGV